MASSDVEMDTRYMWKFSTLHGIFGTPLYGENDVIMVEITWKYGELM